ncbi:hypothetical protein [Microcystis phage Mvi-JY20]|uniref:Uncharacterized protein n=1 Tax=Microcystis phage Mvi-JY20 TaxID=3128146 RepID=A0AAX4QI00_9CAUD
MQDVLSIRPALRAVLVAESAMLNAANAGRMDHWVFGLEKYNSRIFQRDYIDKLPANQAQAAPIYPPNFPTHPKDRHAHYLPGPLSNAIKSDIDNIDALFASQESITTYATESPTRFPLIFAVYLVSRHDMFRRWEFIKWVSAFIPKPELTLLARLFLRVRVSKMLDHGLLAHLSLLHFEAESELGQAITATKDFATFKKHLHPALIAATNKETIANWLLYENVWRLSLGMKFEEQANQFKALASSYYSSTESTKVSVKTAFCMYAAFLALADEYFTMPVEPYYQRLLYRPTFEACLDAAQVF